MADTITFGGRSFKAVKDSTIENDVYVRGMFARSGLSQLHMVEGEAAESFALRILGELSSGTDVFLLLAGLLQPEDQRPEDWSPTSARETAEFLRKLRAPEDKAQLHGQIASLIEGFLRAELISLWISPRSLIGTIQLDQAVSPATSRAQTSNAPASPMENGATSS